MRLRNYTSSSLIIVYLLEPGQLAYSQISKSSVFKPQQNLEQRATGQMTRPANNGTRSLHSQLVETIAKEEERLLPTANAGEYVSDKIGLVVYDDIAKLAGGFGRTIGFDGLMVYQVSGNIVVDNERPFRRLVFYSDKEALEAEGLSPYLANFKMINFKRLKIVTVNGRKVVQEDFQSFDRNFAHIIGMGKYDLRDYILQ